MPSVVQPPAHAASVVVTAQRAASCMYTNLSVETGLKPYLVVRVAGMGESLGLGVVGWGFGFGVLGFGFWIWSFGFGVWGLGFGVWGLGFGVGVLGHGVQEFEFKI